MNYVAEVGLLIIIIVLFYTGLTKNKKYTLVKIKKFNLVIAVVLLLIWLFHDIPSVIEAFKNGWNSASEIK